MSKIKRTGIFLNEVRRISLNESYIEFLKDEAKDKYRHKEFFKTTIPGLFLTREYKSTTLKRYARAYFMIDDKGEIVFIDTFILDSQYLSSYKGDARSSVRSSDLARDAIIQKLVWRDKSVSRTKYLANEVLDLLLERKGIVISDSLKSLDGENLIRRQAIECLHDDTRNVYYTLNKEIIIIEDESEMLDVLPKLFGGSLSNELLIISTKSL